MIEGEDKERLVIVLKDDNEERIIMYPSERIDVFSDEREWFIETIKKNLVD